MRSLRPLTLLIVLTFSALAPAAPRARSTKAQASLKQADALVLVGSFERAAAAYKRALDRNPRLPGARARYGHCLWRLGRTAEALTLLEPLAAGANPPTSALQVLSDIYLDRHDYLRAAGVLEKLVARERTDHRLKLQLARCYRQMADLGNPEARARALSLYAEIERSAADAELRQRAMEAGLAMRFGAVGAQLVAAKRQIGEGQAVVALKALDALADQRSDIPYLHYLRGMAYLSPKLDDRPRAKDAFARAKGHPGATLELGVLLYEEGTLDQATAHLEAALEHDPKSARAYYHLGLVHRERGDDKQAIAAWRKVMRLAPKSPLANWARTKTQVLTGRIRSLAAGQVLDPASEILIGKKTCEQIEKRWPVLKDARLEARLNGIVERLLQHSDRPKRDLRYRVAVINVPIPNALTVPNGKIYVFTGLIDMIRTRMGDTDDAYAAVLAHEISHNVLRHGTGMIKMASTQKEYHSYWQLARLMNALSRTHEYEADEYGALYAYRAGYDPTAAVRMHQKMLQVRGEIPRGMTHPRHADRIARIRDYLLELRAKVRHFKHGVAALEKNAYDPAIDHFELFLGVFPDSAPARNNLAVALHRKALLNTKAAPVYRRSTDIDPEARIRQIRLASTEEERRRRRIDQRLLAEAVGEYRLVLAKDPRYAIGYNNLATALSDLGDLRNAKKHLARALELRPRYKEAHNNLGVVLAQLKDLRGAAESFRRALAIDRKYSAAHFNMALVQEALGDKAAAGRHWARYLSMDGDSGWATVAKARRDALTATR